MKKLLALFSFIILFSGCASTSMIAPERQPNLTPIADKATLVILRDTSLGFAIVFWNYLDGKLIGETKGKTYFVTQVSPGLHYVVVTTENSAVAQIDFKSGKIYYLREGVTMGLWRARTSGFSPLTSQEANESMGKCTYVELDSKNNVGDMDAKLYQQAIADYNKGIKDDPEAFKAMLEYKGY